MKIKIKNSHSAKQAYPWLSQGAVILFFALYTSMFTKSSLLMSGYLKSWLFFQRMLSQNNQH